MVNQSQIEKARTVIEGSSHLSAAEQSEWLALLPFMNDKQLSELLSILRPTPDVASPPPAQSLVAPPLPTAAPISTLDKIPVSAPSSTVAAGTAAVGQANTVSAFISRNFMRDLGRVPTPAPSAGVPASAQRSVPVSDMAPRTPPSVAVEPPAVAAPLPTATSAVSMVPEETDALSATGGGDVEESITQVRSLEDVRRLTVRTLRERGVAAVETELKVLCDKFGYFSVQFALEHSPVYQIYLAVGSRVLKSHASFEEVQAELAAGNRPYLTKPEFEEMSDLLQRIRGV